MQYRGSANPQYPIYGSSGLNRTAVEHYEKQSNGTKSKYFQKRLSTLMNSPQLLQLTDNRVKTQEVKQKMQKEVSKFNVQAEEVVASMVRQSSHRLIRS